MPVQQNDPRELLEILDAEGGSTGQARARAAIHRDGDWHLAFHCWILRDARRQVVLQHRSLLKDTYAGYWDAAAAGHWRFGESAEQAAREIAEELGIEVPFSNLVLRGRERAERTFPNGLTDREFHEVYVLELDQPLIEYRPDPAEVSAVAAFETEGLLALADGTVPRLDALEAVSVDADRTVAATSATVTRDDFVPYSAARLRRMLGRTL